MISKKLNLAINGGLPIRKKEFKSLPYLTSSVIKKVSKLLREKKLSKFVGSPIPGTKKLLSMTSYDANFINETVTFLGGPSVRGLEYEWSKYHNCKYSISVNSATSGLLTGILASGLKPGDEVLCTPFSFTATSAAIVQANAIPVFCDIDLNTFNLDPKKIEINITRKTKAIMAVHWNGNPGHIDKLKKIANKHKLILIEDASQAPGIKYKKKFLGTFGDVGIFSLNEPKNIMTGEGGIVVTNNKKIAVKARLIRNHGEAIVDDSYIHEFKSHLAGYNFRLVEILAEIGIQQVKSLEKLNKIRRKNYLYLKEKILKICPDFLIFQEITNIEDYAPYHVGIRWLSSKSKIHRDLIIHILRTEGIPVSQGMPRLMSENPLFKNNYFLNIINLKGIYKAKKIINKNAKELFDNQYLGFTQIGWPNTKDDMNDIIFAFKKIMANKEALRKLKFDKKYEFISGR